MFYLLSFSYVFLVLVVLFFISRYFRLPFFNALSIMIMVALPVEITKVLIAPLYNGLQDDIYYIEAISINLLFLFLAVTAGCLWIKIFKNLSVAPFREYKCFNFLISKKNLRKKSLFFFAMYVIFFILTMVIGGGGELWLFNTREAYQFYRVGAGVFYAFSITFLALSYGFFAFSFIKKTISIYAVIIFYVALSYFFGSKGTMLNFAIFGLIVLWFYRSRGFYFSLLMVPMLVFPLMIYNLSQAYGDLDLSRIFSYFDYYDNSAMFYKAYDLGQLNFFWGEVFGSQAWSFVPRFIYPEKPFIYGFLHVNEYFFPGAAELTHTPAFGGPTEYYADFGIPGVIFFALFNPTVLWFSFLASNLIFRLRYVRVSSSPTIDARVVLILAFLFFPDFLLYFNAVTKLIFFMLSMLYVYCCCRSRNSPCRVEA